MAKPNTRTDKFGRMLAPSRVNSRAEVVVQAPSGERLADERIPALGVDMEAPARGPVGTGRPSGGTDRQSSGQQGSGEFPRHAGGGYYDLSDNSRVEGKEEAEAAQAELDDKAGR
jgi:hypothetical protein